MRKIMKKLFFILMMTLTVVGMTSCCAKTPKGSKPTSMFGPDSAVCKSLGKSLTDILFSPNKVKVYSLKGVESIGKKDIEIEEHIVRDTLIATLDAKQIALLQYLLLANEENYKNDSVQIRSPYIPLLEFEFMKKKSRAHVLISLQDRTWTVVYDGKVQCNWNYANKELVKRFSNYFITIKNKIKEENKK